VTSDFGAKADIPCRFSQIFWINAETSESIESCFVSIAYGAQVEPRLQSVLRWIGDLQGEWMLVFDGADHEPHFLEHYFPPKNRGNILITTRNPNMKTIVQEAFEIKDMNSSHGINLLKSSHLNPSSEDEVEEQALQTVSQLATSTGHKQPVEAGSGGQLPRSPSSSNSPSTTSTVQSSLRKSKRPATAPPASNADESHRQILFDPAHSNSSRTFIKLPSSPTLTVTIDPKSTSPKSKLLPSRSPSSDSISSPGQLATRTTSGHKRPVGAGSWSQSPRSPSSSKLSSSITSTAQSSSRKSKRPATAPSASDASGSYRQILFDPFHSRAVIKLPSGPAVTITSDPKPTSPKLKLQLPPTDSIPSPAGLPIVTTEISAAEVSDEATKRKKG
jgi:hypothetical protein